ncbi:MAG: sulfotransferase family protein [Acidimicrobiales bacterium]
MPSVPPFPSFVIIGGRRCGARWLRVNLDRHPDICAPPINTAFFADEDRMEALGLRWYREQFGGWRGEPILGEAAPAYMHWSNDPALVARRLKRVLPDVRLVAIVRNPVDRLLSEVRQHVRWGRLPPGADTYSLLLNEDPIIQQLNPARNSIVASAILAYLERFGDDLLVMFHDDLVADPVASYRKILVHVGASPDFVPEGLADVLFSDEGKADVKPLDEEQRRILFGFFRNDVQLLAEWTGRDLSSWDPGEVDTSLQTEEGFRDVWTLISKAQEPPVHQGSSSESTPSAVD